MFSLYFACLAVILFNMSKTCFFEPTAFLYCFPLKPISSIFFNLDFYFFLILVRCELIYNGGEGRRA